MNNIVELFEFQATTKPVEIALKFYNQKLTFDELNQKANQLAHYLVKKGVGKDTIVGICTDRSIEMIVAIFGILKSGGAYLPLDPKLPSDRLDMIVDDSKINIVLTKEKFKNEIRSGKVEMFFLDSYWPKIAGEMTSNLQNSISDDSLAYVIYTSGSTGIPKGVMIEHKSLLTLQEGFNLTAPFDVSENCLSVTPFNFDVSVWEFFISIPFGHCLHLVNTEDIINIRKFAAYLYNYQISCAYFPPSILNELVKVLEESNKPLPLKRLLLGVEPIRQNLLQRLKNLSPPMTIINGYGPTETTICATFYRFDKEISPNLRTPIGKAVPDYEVFLVDENFKKIGTGESGQIIIGGNGLARGYLNAPEHTAAKFVMLSFDGEKERRFYLTGDTGKLLNDGNIEFSGRQDFQLKIRGHRIEPGEVEAAIEKFPGINEVAVIGFDDRNNKKLRAFYTTNGKVEISAKQLAGFLSSKLPDYMVPAAFQQIDSFQRTANQKIDRNALEKYAGSTKPDNNYVVPKTETEIKLAGIWEAVLGLRQISIHENFCDLGGDSIEAAMILTRIMDVFNISISAKEFYENPGINSLATFIDSSAENQVTSLQKIAKVSRETSRFPLSMTQQELWLINQLTDAKTAQNIVLQIRIDGFVDNEIITTAIRLIVNRFEDLRTSFETFNGVPFQIIHELLSFEIPFTDLSQNPKENHHRLTKKISDELGKAEFDLATLPLFKMHLVKFGEEFYELYFVVHHIIFDGWAMGVFLKELKEVYAAILNDSRPQFDEISIQNVDFATWQRNEFDKGNWNPELEFWNKKLTPRPGLIRLSEKQAKGIPFYEGKRYWWLIPEDISAKLILLAKKNNTSLFITMLAVFNVLLFSISSQRRIAIGTPYANRNSREIEKLIGYFTNMISLVSDLDDDLTFETLLQQVHKNCIEAYSNANYPFGQLVKDLEIKHEPNKHPIFQILFIMQNWQMPETEFTKPKFSEKEIGNNTSKFDLTLNAEKIDKGIECWFEFKTHLFEEKEIESLANSFNKLIDTVIVDPHQRIGEMLKMDSFVKSFSAYIIGNGSTLMLCAEVLLRKQWKIHGIITSDTETAKWAKKNGISHFDPENDFSHYLEDKSFDFLFSINNDFIITEKIINLPKRGSINYHNSLLPKYAGVYASHHAILNQEKYHGVSWHFMTNKVDAGDILKQQSFEISDNDTVATLDVKCFEAAISSFDELVEDILNESLTPVKQNLDERTCYRLCYRPEMACTLSWDKDAREINTFFKSLTYGNNLPNELGAPKLFIDGKFYIIQKLSVTKVKSGKPCGTVTGIETDGFSVATTTNDVRVENILEINGNQINIKNFLDFHKIGIGNVFEPMNAGATEILTRFYNRTGRNEGFWVKKLAKIEQVNIPFISGFSDNQGKFDYLSLNHSEIETRLGAVYQIAAGEGFAETSISIIYLFFAKITENQNFTISLQQAEFSDKPVFFDELFYDFVPFSAAINFKDSYRTNKEIIGKTLQLFRKNGTFTRDIFYRYPNLTKNESQSVFHNSKVIITLSEASAVPDQFLSRHALNFLINQDTGRIDLFYSPELISHKNLLNLMDLLNTFAANIFLNSDIQLSNVSLLSEAEKHKILHNWNIPSKKHIVKETVHKLFEAQVAKTPDAKAVIFQDQIFTYRQLNVKANQLANHFLSLGYKNGFFAGIMLDRSPEMIITLLAILKAGGAYVPIDSRYPRERILQIIADTKMDLAITSSAYAPLLPGNFANIVCLDFDLEIISRNSHSNPGITMDSSELAYIIFTSGSTGRPKGVLIEHRSLVSFIMATIENFKLTASDNVLQFSTIAFDTSVEEIYPILCCGGTLVLRTHEMIESAQAFVDFCNKFEITVIDLPTAFWNNLTIEIVHKNLTFNSSLRLTILGGEQIQRETVKLWWNHFNDFPRLVNSYGPTEATVVTTCYFIDDQYDKYRTIPIGRPLENAKVYIVDKFGHLLPPGIPGELVIGGTCLARGYLNNSRLTDEIFIPDPFDAEENAKMYRTGDVAMFLDDGNLEFIGRIDNQVKIRGFRIEVDEIDAVLSQHENIRESVTIAIKDEGNSPKLVSYIIPENSAFDDDEIRDFLKLRLPEYMIPLAFVEMFEFPLTASLKIDKLAFPKPDFSKASGKDFLLPSTETEKKLFVIWKDILKLQRFSTSASFFDLGGDSLSSVLLLSKVADIFGQVHISLKEFYIQPTVKDLAQFIDKFGNNSTSSDLPPQKKQTHDHKIKISYLTPFQPDGSKIPLIMIYGDNANHYLPGFLGKDQPYWAFMPQGTDGERIKCKTVGQIAKLYVAELLETIPEKRFHLAGYSFGGLVALEMSNLLLAKGCEVKSHIFIDTLLPRLWKTVRHKTTIRQRVKRFRFRWIRRFYVLLGRNIPTKYRSFYILEIFQAAYCNYQITNTNTTIELIKSSQDKNEDSHLGWNRMADFKVNIHNIPGDHYSIIRNRESLKIIAATIQEITDAAK